MVCTRFWKIYSIICIFIECLSVFLGKKVFRFNINNDLTIYWTFILIDNFGFVLFYEWVIFIHFEKFSQWFAVFISCSFCIAAKDIQRIHIIDLKDFFRFVVNKTYKF